jgi:Ni/Co efflux regulator RcnB
MKKLLVSTFALALMATVPQAVWAQDDHHDQGGGNKGGQHDAGPKNDSNAKGSTTGMSGHTDTTSGNATNGSKFGTGTTHRTHRTTTRSATSSAVRPTLHFKADINTYKRTFQARRQFHAGTYRAPPGYTYRRWGLGERLPNEYFVSDFWLNNFADYDLATPPDGYVWVRYGPDALLIDQSDGEVIQVAYGVFD